MTTKKKNKIQNLTFNELLEIFGKDNILRMCEQKEADHTQETFETKKELKKREQKRANARPEDIHRYDTEIELTEERLERQKARLRHWQYKKKQAQGEPVSENYVDKEELKQIPISRIMELLGYKEYGRSQGRTYYKIREEKTASCVYFHNTNSFYDFGMSQGGDNIALIQLIYNCNFGQACRILKDMI